MKTSRSRRFALLLSLALALLVASCGSDGGSTTAGDGTATDDGDASGDEAADGGGTSISPVGRWVLESLTIDGAPVEILADQVFDLEIEAGGISGRGGCNQFGGSVDIGLDGSFAARDMAMTEMACEPIELLDFETVYVGALARADSWEVTPTGLILAGPDVDVRYQPAPAEEAVALEGTEWVFDTIFSGSGVDRAASSVIQGRADVVLVITDGTAVLAADDCGDVSFALRSEDGVDGNIATDGTGPEVSCSADASNLPAALEGVLAASGFSIWEGRLTFIGLEGETVGFRAR